VLSQGSALTFGLTVAEVVELGRLPHRGTPAAAQDRDALAAMRAAFALDPLWRRQFPTLSGGERPRVQLARAAAQLWYLDGDQRGRLLFLEAAWATVLAVLHDPNRATRADQVVVIRNGRLPAAGRPADVLTEKLLADCYGLAVSRIARPDGTAAFLAA
jgi:iron complex transport system ATP-binding protein